jgi:hypothetical protein
LIQTAYNTLQLNISFVNYIINLVKVGMVGGRWIVESKNVGTDLN